MIQPAKPENPFWEMPDLIYESVSCRNLCGKGMLARVFNGR